VQKAAEEAAKERGPEKLAACQVAIDAMQQPAGRQGPFQAP
jgi:hypothetical protein